MRLSNSSGSSVGVTHWEAEGMLAAGLACANFFKKSKPGKKLSKLNAGWLAMGIFQWLCCSPCLCLSAPPMGAFLATA